MHASPHASPLTRTIATVALQARKAAARLAKARPLSPGKALRRLAVGTAVHTHDELAEAQMVVDAHLATSLAAVTAAPADAIDAIVADQRIAAGAAARRAVQWALVARALDGDEWARQALAAHAA